MRKQDKHSMWSNDGRNLPNAGESFEMKKMNIQL